MTLYLLPIILFLIAIKRPIWAFFGLILIWPSYLLRGTVVGIPTTALELSLYAVTLVTGFQLFRRRLPWHWVLMTRGTWMLLGLWTFCWLLSSYFALDRTAALGATKAWLVDPLLGTALAAILVRTVSEQIRTMQVIICSGCSVALAGLGQVLFFRDTLQDERLSSFFAPVANYAAMYLGPILILAVGMMMFMRVSRWWWVAVVVLATAQLLTLSYGGYLAIVAGGTLLWWFMPQRRIRRRVALGGALVAALFVLGLSTTTNFREHFNPDRSSGAVRTQIWVTSWAIIKQHPLVGIGPNNFEAAYRRELPRHYYPPLEWLVAQPHNLALALWLETGLIGLFSFIGLIIFHLYNAIIMYRQQAEQRAMILLSLAGLLAVLVHGLVDTPYFKNDLAFEFLLIAMLPWIGRGRAPTEATNT